MKRDGLGVVLPISSEAVEVINAWMPECYSGDDYPREGCTIVLTVGADKVRFASYAPNGRLLEAGPTFQREQAGIAVDEWLRGVVPKVYRSADVLGETMARMERCRAAAFADQAERTVCPLTSARLVVQSSLAFLRAAQIEDQMHSSHEPGPAAS